MTFSIHMAGASRQRSFIYQKKDVARGDPLEDKLVQYLMGKAAPAKAYEDVIKKMPSITLNATRHALQAMSAQAKGHVLELGLAGLKMKAPGRLHVLVRHTHVLWPTTGDNLQLFVEAGRGIDTDMHRLLKFLRDNGMGEWGPLLEMSLGFYEFGQSDCGSGYLVQVTLTD